MSSCFWSNKANTDAPADFQVSLLCDESVDISELRFSAMHISFHDGRPDIDRPDLVVQAGDESVSDDFFDLGVVGYDEIPNATTSALVWTPGKRITFHGRMLVNRDSDVEVSLPVLFWQAGEADEQITCVKLVLAQSAWTFELLLNPGTQSAWYTPKGAIVPFHELSSDVS